MSTDRYLEFSQHPNDTCQFAPHALEKIIGIAARDVPGILALRGNFVDDLTANFIDGGTNPTRGVITEAEGKNLQVYLRLALQYGIEGPSTLRTLRTYLAERLYRDTGYVLVALYVDVVDIMTEEEFLQQLRNRFQSYSVHQNMKTMA